MIAGRVPLAAPTYILREAAREDLAGVLERLGALGFAGVELMGLFGRSPNQVAESAQTAGLRVIGVHVPGVIEGPWPEVIDDVAACGARYVTFEWPGPLGGSVDAKFAWAIEDLTERAELASTAGLKPLYHNHDAELAYPVDHDPDSSGHEARSRMLDLILDQVPGLGLEPDLGWMVYAGADPASYLRKYRQRCQVVHLKDLWADELRLVGPKEDLGTTKRRPDRGRFEFRPTGFGMVNYPALLADILACEPEWLVLDHDSPYERDAYADLALSLSYIQQLLALHLD